MLQGIRAILDSSADSGIVVRFPGLSFAVTRGGQTRFCYQDAIFGDWKSQNFSNANTRELKLYCLVRSIFAD